jgi:hypothetical protein
MVKPGFDDEIRRLFATYGRPDSVALTDSAGNCVGKLLSTAVFMKDRRIVRVIEYEGELPYLIRHMAGQSIVRDLEDKLSPYLETPRDTSSSEGFRKFFLANAMECLVARRQDDHRTEPVSAP